MALPSTARSQEAPLELARHEFLREAEEAARRGDHALAIERARRAATLRATPSVAHFLAREHAAQGQHLESLAQAATCERGAEADRGLHNRDALIRACRDLVARAAAHVARVVVRVVEPVPAGLSVQIAGSTLPVALLGAPYAVEPGLVQVEAEAPGHAPFRRALDLEAGQVVQMDLALTPLPPAAPPPVPVTVAPPPSPPRVVPPTAATAPTGSRVTWLAVGLSLTSLAGAGFVAAGVSFATAQSALSARDAACPSPCAVDAPGYPMAQPRDAQYRASLDATTWTLVAGASAAAAATLWWLLARPRAARAVPVLSAGRDGAGLGIAARW